MWPLPQIKNEHLHVVMHADRVTCIQYRSENNLLHLCNYRMYYMPVGNNRLFENMTAVQNAISDFITVSNLAHAHINIILGSELLTEQLIRHTKSDASLQDVISELDLHTEYCMQYVGPVDDGFLFYISQIAQALKLQLQMLHASLPVHMHRIISPFAAQLHVYKHIAAPAFSRARLAQEIDIERVRISAVFSPEIVRRSLKIDQGMYHSNQDIIFAWGSYLGALQ